MLLIEGIRMLLKVGLFHCGWFISDEERAEEAEATADGDAEGEREEEEEQRSGSEKADSDQEEEAEKSEASAKEGSDGGLFCSVIVWMYCKYFANLQD
jgi:hypothetical protein